MVDNYPRFKAFCRVVDVIRAIELPDTDPSDASESNRPNFLRKLIAAGLGDIAVKEIKECFRMYLNLYDERIAFVKRLADVLMRYGASTISECVERISQDDKLAKKVLHDFDQLVCDAREAERRLGRQPKQTYTLDEEPAADDMIVLAAALRAGMLGTSLSII